MREAIFGILGAARELQGARVLDLYAGTGALALEALSRGAAHATLVERERSALAALGHNIDALDAGAHTKVVALPVERGLRALAGSPPFDIIFADPPYALVRGGEAGRALQGLVTAGLVAARASVVLEHASSDAAPVITGLSLEQSRRYGDTTVSFYAGSP